MLGLALGDAFGAPYEGGILERGLWCILGTCNGKRRWTDDTQMTIDVIESLLACGRVDQADLAKRFAVSYRWSRGYGPGAAKVLKRIRRGQDWQSAALAVFPGGSYGNGGAMRAPAVGIFHAGDGHETLAEAADAVAAITHAHPLGREGAVLVATATALTFRGLDTREIIETLSSTAHSDEFVHRLGKAGNWLVDDAIPGPRQVAAELGNGIAAVQSCVTAVFVALAFRDRAFAALLDYCRDLRGDVDTISAMAGALWGAARGYSELPESRLAQLERRSDLERLAQSLGALVASSWAS